jgi:acyl carrier protein
MISERLVAIVAKVLDLDDLELEDETTADQVPGWDSLSHVRVLAAIEKAYGFRFKTMEVLRWIRMRSCASAVMIRSRS